MATKVAAAKKDWDLVIQWGEKALSIEPDNGSLYGALMEAYKAKGDKAKALEYEKKFIAANPDKYVQLSTPSTARICSAVAAAVSASVSRRRIFADP